MIPQIALIALFAMSLGATIAKRGQKRENYSVTSALISIAMQGGLLYWGGFFDVLMK